MARSSIPMQWARKKCPSKVTPSGASASAQQAKWTGSVSASTPSKSNRMASNSDIGREISAYHVVSLKLNIMPTEEELKAELDRLRAENEMLKKPARGMMRREVERREVVEVVLDILGHRDFEAHRLEDLQHFFENVGDWMEVAARDAHAGQRHVEAFFIKRFRQRRGFEFLAQSLDARFDFALDLIDELADGGPLRIGDLAH